MKQILITIFCLISSLGLFAQVSVNTNGSAPDSSAMLDVQSTDKGFLMPRMTTAERDAIPQPATGLQIYNTDVSAFNYYNGTEWQTSQSPWKVKGDSIYYDAGLVGIGTDVPTEKLTLEGGNFLQTPGNPTHAGAITDNGTTVLNGARDIFVSGKYAYVASFSDNGVEILDISDPTNPTHVGAITDNGTTELLAPRSIYVSGKYAYVASFVDDGVEILDISDPTNPTHVGAITDNGTTALSGANSIYVSGKYAYVTSRLDDGVEILDISDPANPTHVGAIFDNGTTALRGARSIYVSGKYAYVAAWIDDGVEILDISDPTNPTHVGAIFDNGTTELDGASDIYVSGKYAYVASEYDNGVEILDISDPSNPTHVGAISDNGTTKLDNARGIYVSGKYAYVASVFDNGVEILDISDPSNPTHVGAITDNGTTELLGASSIYVSGKYAYVASEIDDGVEILDISGLDVPSANIGNIVSNQIDVSEKAQIGKLSVREDLNVGKDMFIDGDIAANGQITASSFIGDGSALTNLPSSADNLGDHIATQPLDLANNNINNGGIVTATAFIGDGSGLTNLPSSADNLGDHTATTNLSLNNHWLSGDGDNEGIFVKSNGNIGIRTGNPHHLLDLGSTNGRKLAIYQSTTGSDFYGFGILGQALEIHASSNATGDPKMVVRNNGNVGIGTTNPTKAKLEISGNQTHQFIGVVAAYPINGQSTLNVNPINILSMYAENGVAGAAFLAHSDARIKSVLGKSNSVTDLTTLMQIEVTDYRMRDSLSKGNRSIKKVVAQQVAEVYPQAVTNNLTEVIPDIYQRAEINEGWIMLTTNLEPGERVKIITEQNSKVYEVKEVKSDRFSVSNPSLLAGEAFIYGREVDDFHTVDYEALSMLNVSATQEQQRLIEDQQKQIEALKAQLEMFQTLQAEQAKLAEELASLKNHLNAQP